MAAKFLSAKHLQKCGKQKGFVTDKSGVLLLAAGQRRGIFVSRTYDSTETDTCWDRLKLHVGDNTPFSVYVLLFSRPETGLHIDGMEDLEEQYTFMKRHAAVVSSYEDVLLYKNGRKGTRYLKLCIEILRGQELKKYRLEGYEITFPKDNFMRYLPSVYQENPELEKYMAAVQQQYLDLEDRIDGIAMQLDYECCDRRQLLQLTGFLGYERQSAELESAMLIRLLRGGTLLARRKGTGRYYTDLVTLLTGEKAVLTEDKPNKKCTLLIRCRPEEIRRDYVDWIVGNAPLGVEMEAVYLCPSDRLTEGCFLDYTAQISEKECALGSAGVNIDNILLI